MFGFRWSNDFFLKYFTIYRSHIGPATKNFICILSFTWPNTFFLLQGLLYYLFFLLSTFSKKIKINSQLILFSFYLLSIVLSKEKVGKLFPNIKCLLISLEGSNGKGKKKIFQLYFTYQPIVCFVCCYLHFQLISKVFKSMK